MWSLLKLFWATLCLRNTERKVLAAEDYMSREWRSDNLWRLQAGRGTDGHYTTAE